MTVTKITWVATLLATLTAMTFARPVRINADGSFKRFLGSIDGYPNAKLDSDDPKPPNKTNFKPKKYSIFDTGA
jgi:hypothetical protein